MTLFIIRHPSIRTPRGPAVRRNRAAARAGFTIAEAMVAIALISVAGSALLLDTTSLIATTDVGMRQAIANGLAQQLMDEIAGMRYMEPGDSPTKPTLGPNSGESGGPGRSQFDDIDDYNGYASQPPVDRYGTPLGTEDGDGTPRYPGLQLNSGALTKFKQQVSVFYVQNTALTTPLKSGSTSYYRAVQVNIVYQDPALGPQTLATLIRVFTYVPSN
jgi:type II secretory pathway pseudopilin PulG